MIGFPIDGVVTLTLPELSDVPDLPPAEVQRVARSIVCWGEWTPALARMTPAQWSAVIAERERIGRPLECDEVLLLIETQDGVNDHR